MNAIAIALHVVAAVVWVGGLFFAYVVLRPTTGTLEPPIRLALWAGVFKRFFPWVWMSIIILMVSGYWLIFGWFKGFTSSSWSCACNALTRLGNDSAVCLPVLQVIPGVSRCGTT